MKKIYESPLNGWDESAERIHVYALEEDNEFWELYNMSFEGKCELFNVFDETGYLIAPGAMYRTYEFHLTVDHIIMIETMAYNV